MVTYGAHVYRRPPRHGPLMVLLVLFLYDYLITFEQEVRFIWGRKLTGANVIFILNRYPTLVMCLMVVIGCWPVECEVSAFTMFLSQIMIHSR